MNDQKIIKVGSRKSELALIQTRHVISLLEQHYPEKKFEIVTMNTLGDNVLDIPLPKIGEKSLFTKELEAALLSGSVDFVVHSLKDLPTSLPDGMTIGAILTREDPRDALVLNGKYKDCNLETLPKGSVIGTSSLRRSAQLSRKYPHLVVESIRGNLNTRLKKLDELNKYSAIILASAGLNRIGWHERISAILEAEDFMYAVGQGALAVECRQNDENIINLLSPLYELETAIQVLAERSFLKTLGGGCSAPVAVTCKLQEFDGHNKLSLKGGVWSLDGQIEIIDSLTTNILYKKDTKCKDCPFKNVSGSDATQETIKCFKKCSSFIEDEVPRKRQKINDAPSIDVLKDDPHEQCPIEMPIGSDFMGKCPFLENSPTSAKKLLEKMESKLPDKCPFQVIEKNDLAESSSSINEISNPFCGMVLHKNVDEKVFEEIELLGRKLAKALIEKGALEVMAKARSSIHA